jgi:hypothetical protein
MMRATTKVLLALFCVAAVGCAAAREEQQRAANAPTANVAGQWSGQAGTGGTFVPINLSLSQNGTKVTGNAMVGGRPDLSGPVTGDVQGDVVHAPGAGGHDHRPELTVGAGDPPSLSVSADRFALTPQG